jgi:hypothetical protein
MVLLWELYGETVRRMATGAVSQVQGDDLLK